MPLLSIVGRVLITTIMSGAAIFPSYQLAAEAAPPDPEAGLPQALTLLAPFACGSEWQGTTYPGHGSNNWNLDLNRAGADHGTDLGQPLLAQADGTVVWFKQTGWNRNAGTYLEIDYGDVSVRYLHLVAGSIPEPVAELGARVRAGELIGRLGATGRASGPHLHLEYWNSADFDDSPWYQLPRRNHLPVAFAGTPMIASPGSPSPVVRSTNCTNPSIDEKTAELDERLYAAPRPSSASIAATAAR